MSVVMGKANITAKYRFIVYFPCGYVNRNPGICR
ncbi:MAG: hypothetical protein BWY81_00577 [Firmicutes bacterium ADurb.Bin467]|nr:MAG: hypothetical protein BWY81_00577 [Firmicutes bacterium ADurb.Bin467]